MFSKVRNFMSPDNGSNSDLKTLMDMGFNVDESRQVLDVTNGDVSQAASLLLSNTTLTSTTVSTQPVRATTTTSKSSYDSDLQHALQESLQTVNKGGEIKQSTKRKQNLSNYQEVLKMKQAIQESLKMKSIENTSTSRVRYKVPPQLQDKSKEEQISRCISRMQPYPGAVDSLIFALTKIRDDPANQKYRKIHIKSSGYQETLANVPGIEGLLLALNFYKNGNDFLILDRLNVDLASFWLAISMLEDVTTSSKEYMTSKKKIQFHRTIQEMLTSNTTKNNILSHKLSSEPDSTQNSSTIQIYFSDSVVRKRKFYPDDTLEDILYWIGTISHEILQKITAKEWCLIDRDTSPCSLVHTDNNKTLKKTLQTLGWWPSGRLQIVLFDMLCEDNSLTNLTTDIVNTRGLD